MVDYMGKFIKNFLTMQIFPIYVLYRLHKTQNYDIYRRHEKNRGRCVVDPDRMDDEKIKNQTV